MIGCKVYALICIWLQKWSVFGSSHCVRFWIHCLRHTVELWAPRSVLSNFNQNSRQSPERLLLYQPAVHSMALHTYIVPAWNNWLSELSAYRYFWTILIACTVHLGKCYIFRCLKMRLWHNWVKICSQHFCWQRPQLSGSHTKRCFCRTGIWFLSLCFSPSVRACPR